MRISYDPAKREKTIVERGLDFEDAGQVFAGPTVDFIDDRRDYGEARWVSFGKLRGRMVVLIGTARGTTRHIISMRKANGREQENYGRQLGS